MFSRYVQRPGQYIGLFISNYVCCDSTSSSSERGKNKTRISFPWGALHFKTGRVSCVCDWLSGLDSGDRSWICNAAVATYWQAYVGLYR